ncbi:ROK family protein [Arthrobacter sp. KN11-1C]|uniref:ROK family protein n=1 Tax=Arthrobacter sp. KN11-1C TaxID=3445774 RepID=UPI003FA08F2D
MTRTELSSISGLARTTVGTRLEELTQIGLVSPVDVAPSTGGRPSSQFSFDPTARVVLAFDIEPETMSVGVTDLRGSVLDIREQPLKVSEGPAVVLAEAIATGRRILQDLGKPEGLLVGVGIGLAGYTEIAAGRQHTLPGYEKWTESTIKEPFEAFCNLPVLIDNDVNVLALGEQQMHSGSQDLIVVKIAAGIGSGIIAGGKLQTGTSGMGGIGHTRVPRGQDIVCRCGNSGCLEAMASTRALIRTLSGRGFPVRSTSDLIALVQEEDTDAVQAVRQAGRDLGTVLAVYASILNPSLIALSGPLVEAGEHMLGEARKTIYDQASPLVTGDLQIVRAMSSQTTAVTGAGRMVIEHVLSPKGIEEMLSSPFTGKTSG